MTMESIISFAFGVLSSAAVVLFTAGRLVNVIVGHGRQISETHELAQRTDTTVTRIRIEHGETLARMEERQIGFEVRLSELEESAEP